MNQRYAKMILLGFLIALALPLVMDWLASPAFAQDAAAAAPAAGEPAKKTVESKTLWQVIKGGGIVMIPLFICSVVVFAFALEGFMRIRIEYVMPAMLCSKLKEVISSGNYDEAIRICKANPRFITRVLGGGLTRLGRGKEAVEYALEEHATREAMGLRARNSYLSTIAVISPMIGLLGTVLGMIAAFRELGVGGTAHPEKLAEAIGEVLIATATGLFVAVPAFIFYFIIRNRIQQVTLSVENKINDLIEDIPFQQTAPAAAAPMADYAAPAPQYAPPPPPMPTPAPWQPEAQPQYQQQYQPPQVQPMATPTPLPMPQWGVPAAVPAVGPSASGTRMAAPAMLVACPNCNAQIPHGTQRCGSCGTTLAWN